MPKNNKKTVIFLIAFLLLFVDQSVKYFVRRTIPIGGNLGFIPGFIEIKHTKNTGMAFSFFDAYPFILTVIVSSIMFGLLIYLLRAGSPSPFWAFVLGGGLSNLLDRYLFHEVTDYLNFLFMDFAVFNLADVFLNMGVLLMIFIALSKKEI